MIQKEMKFPLSKKEKYVAMLAPSFIVDFSYPSIISQMIFRKEITQPGAYAPEDIVPVESFFRELRKRKMLVYENGKVIN